MTDKIFEEQGAQRLAPRGFADAAEGDIFNDFDKWIDEKFWPAVEEEYGQRGTDAPETAGLDIEVTTGSRSSILRQNVSEAIVEDVKILTAPGEPEKRHIELQLPTDMTYKAGDYLAILPINHSKIVKRVMNRFGLAWDAVITIKEGQNTILPAHKMSLYAMLSAYVELNQPATVKVSFYLIYWEPFDLNFCPECHRYCLNYPRRSRARRPLITFRLRVHRLDHSQTCLSSRSSRSSPNRYSPSWRLSHHAPPNAHSPIFHFLLPTSEPQDMHAYLCSPRPGFPRRWR